MTNKLPDIPKEIMIHFILDYLAGNMAKPAEIKIELSYEYSFQNKDFDSLIEELADHDLIDKRGDYLTLTQRGRYLLKESPDFVSLKSFELMKEADPSQLVLPKITQKPKEMLRWYKRVFRYFPSRILQLIASLILFFLVYYFRYKHHAHIPRSHFFH
jgi:predicted transcriptional regulator